MEVGKYVGAAAVGWLLSELDDSDESAAEQESELPEVCPAPWERGKEIGDAQQSMDKIRQFVDQLDIAAGSNPNGPAGGSRLTRLAGLLAALLESLRH